MQILVEDAVGLIGVGLTLIAYFLLQIELIKSEHFSYSFINAVGSVLILYSLIKTWNLSSAVMEVSWLLVSLYGCTKYFIRKK